MAVVVALVVGVVMVVAVVAALGVGVFLQAVLCVDLVVVVSVCVALAVAKAAIAPFTVAASVVWVLPAAVWGGGGRVKEVQRAGLNIPSTPSKTNRTKFTVTVYSDSVS